MLTQTGHIVNLNSGEPYGSIQIISLVRRVAIYLVKEDSMKHYRVRKCIILKFQTIDKLPMPLGQKRKSLELPYHCFIQISDVTNSLPMFMPI